MPNLKSKNFQNFFLYQVLWTLNFLEGAPRTNIILVTPNLRPKMFQNFFIYRVLRTLNFSERVGVQAQNFLGYGKFETKNFSELFHSQSTLDSEFFIRGGPDTNFFWSHQIWGQYFFGIFWSLTRAALDCEFFGESGGLGTNFFWSCQIWGQKIFRTFSFTDALWTLNFLTGEWISRLPTFFGHALNLRSNIISEFFSFTKSALDSNFFWGGWGSRLPTSFGYAKFDVKK